MVEDVVVERAKSFERPTPREGFEQQMAVVTGGNPSVNAAAWHPPHRLVRIDTIWIAEDKMLTSPAAGDCCRVGDGYRRRPLLVVPFRRLMSE
jgi:hypothetical protein